VPLCSNASGDALLLVDIIYLEIDLTCFKVTNSEIGVIVYLIWMSPTMLSATQWLEHVDVDELLWKNNVVLWDDAWGIISHCTVLICFFLRGLSWRTNHWIIGLDLLGSYNYKCCSVLRMNDDNLEFDQDVIKIYSKIVLSKNLGSSW